MVCSLYLLEDFNDDVNMSMAAIHSALNENLFLLAILDVNYFFMQNYFRNLAEHIYYLIYRIPAYMGCLTIFFQFYFS